MTGDGREQPDYRRCAIPRIARRSRSVADCVRRRGTRISIRIVGACGGRLALRASRRDDRRRRHRAHRGREAGRRRRGECRNRGGRRPGALSHVGIVHAHTSAVVRASVRVDAAYACGGWWLVNSGRYRRVVSGRRDAAAERTQQTRRNQVHRASSAGLRKVMTWCLEDVYDIYSAKHVLLPP